LDIVTDHKSVYTFSHDRSFLLQQQAQISAPRFYSVIS